MTFRMNHYCSFQRIAGFFGLCLLFILFLTMNCFPSNFFNSESQNYTPQSSPYGYPTILHDPIEIQEETDFDVLTITGDGLSWESAYNISNMSIEMPNSFTAIMINNSNRYCIIENCQILNSYPIYRNISAAILIQNSSHVRIINCEITVQSASVARGFQFDLVSDIVLRNCQVNGGEYGGVLSRCSNISVENCNFYYYDYDGLWITESNYVRVNNSRFILTDPDTYSSEAVYFSSCSHLTLENNFFSNYYKCIMGDSSNNSLLQYNEIRSSIYGGWFINSTNMTVISNKIHGNLDFLFCHNLLIADNQFQFLEEPLVLTNSFNFSVRSNIFHWWRLTALKIHYVASDYYPIPQDLSQSTQEIVKNVFYISGRGVMDLPKENIAMIRFWGNFYIPQLAYFVILVCLICIGYLIAKISSQMYVIRLKINDLVQSVDNISINASKDMFNAVKTGFNQVFRAHQYSQYTFLASLLLGSGILIPICLKSLYRGYSFIQIAINSIIAKYHQPVFDLVTSQVLSQIEVIFLWILALIAMYVMKKKFDQQLKQISSLPGKISPPPFKWYIIIFITSTILVWGLLFFVVNWGLGFYLNFIMAGVFALVFLIFLVNTVRKRQKMQFVPWELAIIAIILLLGGIWIIRSIDPNIYNSSNPVEISTTATLIRWTCLLASLAMWVRGIIHLDSNSSKGGTDS